MKPYHPYRWLKKTFNESQEIEGAPKPLAGHEVVNRVNDIITIFGKTQKKDTSERNIPRLSARKNLEEGWAVHVRWVKGHPAKRTTSVHPLSEKGMR